MVHSANVIGKAFKSRLNHAVDGGWFDTVVEVEAKQLRGTWGEVQVSEQIVAGSVGDLMLQEEGIHFPAEFSKLAQCGSW